MQRLEGAGSRDIEENLPTNYRTLVFLKACTKTSPHQKEKKKGRGERKTKTEKK